MNLKMTVCSMALGLAAVAVTVPARADVTDMDKQFLTKASQSDFNEIKLSQLAADKATNPKVKAFANKMVTDHNMLESEMKPYADAWSLTPASSLDAEHQAEYDKLSGLSGKDFDDEYMKAMDMDHHKALDAFKSEEGSTTDMKFKKSVAKGEKVVAQHTMMADKMTKMMGVSTM